MTSIVIVNWNGARYLPALLRSIEPESVEHVLVVDNQSTDDSIEVLKTFPAVRVIANDRNTGYGTAANQGIETCLTPFVFLLNVDVTLRSGCVEILETYMNDHPDVAIAAPQLLHPDGTLQLSIRSFPTPVSMALYLSYLDRLFGSSYRARRKDHTFTRPVDQPMGAAMMLRKSMYEDAGGFDPQFFLYMEEVDLCYRMKTKGYDVAYVSEAKAIHHAGGSSQQAWERSQQNFLDSASLYFNKHFPASTSRMWRRLLPPALLFRSLILLFAGRFRQSHFYFAEALKRL